MAVEVPIFSEHAGDRERVDAVWSVLVDDAQRLAAEERALAATLHRLILDRTSLADSLAAIVTGKLANDDLPAAELGELVRSVLSANENIVAAAAIDLLVSLERNPAYADAVTPFAFAKGYVALQAHRVAHALWNDKRRGIATVLQLRVADAFAVDIHPAARIGRGVFIDHATGVVIGETAVVADDVSILHDVTLGGTGKERGDRHPKISRGVLLGAGAKVLGNVTVGESAKIAAGSVVLEPVPAFTTVAGIPARIVGRTHGLPSHTMDQEFLDFQI